MAQETKNWHTDMTPDEHKSTYGLFLRLTFWVSLLVICTLVGLLLFLF